MDEHARKPDFKTRALGELRSVFLATAYFLVGFNLLAVLIALLVPGVRTLSEAMATATVLALVVGKVVVLSEGLVERVVRRGGSFLGAVLQRALMFTVLVALVLATEAVLHGMIGESLSFEAALEHALQEGSWQRTTARVLYLMVLFSLYGLLFELDTYLAPRTLTDIVTSRYLKPHAGEAVVMRLGLVDPIDPLNAEHRVALIQRMYAASHAQAERAGAVLELFGGARGVLIWEPAQRFERAHAEQAYAGIARLLETEADTWSSRLGQPLRLKAVVTRGVLQTFEVGTAEQRQILRDGSALERAEHAFHALHEPGLVFES